MPFFNLKAQTPAYPELEYFQESAQELSILYRGKQAEKYTFPFNGNCYWDGSEFGKGELMYLGKLYQNLNINIDAVLQQPLVKMSSGTISIGLAAQDVEYMVIDGDRYENLSLSGREGAVSGFYQLLAEGGGYKLYKKVDKKVDSSVDPVNGIGIGYQDPFYRSNVHTYFKYMPSFYLVHNDGPLVHFRSRSAMLKLFPERRKELKKAMNSFPNSSYGYYSENYYVEVIKCLSR